MGMPEMESADGSSGQTSFSKLPKMKKPVMPDTQDLKKQTDKLTVEIERYADRIKEIKSTLDNRRGRNQVSAKEREVMRVLNDSRAEFQKNLKLKQSVRAELTRVNEKRESLRTQVRHVKEKGRAVEDFDAQIKKIEHRINTEDLTPEDEERAINQIKQLAKSREAVKKHNQDLNSIQGDDALREELIAKMKSLDEELDKLKVDENRNKAQLQKIRSEQAVESDDFESLVQEKQDCWEVMKALREKRSQIKEEIDNVTFSFRKENALFREQAAKERQMRDDQRRAEYEKNSAEREAKKKEYEAFQKDSKKNEDIICCDQLLAYLSKFVQVKTEEPKTGGEELNEAPAEGMRLLKKGDDELMNSWLFKANAETKKSKGKKSRKPVEKPVDKRVNHPLDSLSAFHFLRITVPNTVSEVAKAIEAIKQKKKDIQEGKLQGPSGSSSANKPEKSKETEKSDEAVVEDAEKENDKGSPDVGNEIQKDEVEVEKKDADVDEEVDDNDADGPTPAVTPDDAEEPKVLESDVKSTEPEEVKEEFPPLGGDRPEEEQDEQPAEDKEE
ncbi:hypothetical protein BSKO_00511 [Bryopsis sp. KO-2023]|nr:hypothetical protein BSKO_00511 [Bryopsis sp. KO-2023]